MSSKRDIEKLVSQLDMKNGQKREVVQYGKGMLDGKHLAYVAVARKLLAQGNSTNEVRRFLSDMMDSAELRAIMKDAQGEL